MLRLAATDGVAMAVATLATWRLTKLLCHEDGPYDVLLRLRGLLVRLGAERLVTCFHCASLWIALAAVLAIYEVGWQSIPLTLAVAGGASVVQHALDALAGRADQAGFPRDDDPDEDGDT